MGWFAKRIMAAANPVLAPFGCRVVPSWARVVPESMLEANPLIGSSPRFEFGGQSFPYFVHHHNCGWPPPVATERTVELAIADYWLNQVPLNEIIEVGAVTPYYWPGRVSRVVDPADPSPFVTERRLVSEVDLTGASVLSISTYEHIGQEEYGMPAKPLLLEAAINQLLTQAKRFLVTVPIGYNAHMDKIVFSSRMLDDVSMSFVVRHEDGASWSEVSDPESARQKYGRLGANTVCVFERGGLVLRDHPK